MSGIIQKKRITDILFSHWDQARGERLFPSRGEIDEFKLQKEQAWDDVFIVDIFPLVQSNGYRFSYKGKNLSDEFISAKNGKVVNSIVTGFFENFHHQYNMVSEHKRPLQHEEIYTSPETGVVIKYRQILLPLGPDDDSPIEAIIGGMRFIRA